MDFETRIGIVGTGIAGLTTAIALHEAGFRPRLFEQSGALGDVGAGITLAPNASRVLLALGLEAALAEHVWTPRHTGILHFATGQPVSLTERGDHYRDHFGAPFWHVHRADLLAVLAGEVARRGIPIAFGHRLADVVQHKHGVTVRFEAAEPAELDLLVACDGIKSRTRDLLFETEPPRFTGYVAWRGLVDRSRLPGLRIAPDFGLYVGPGRMVGRYAVRKRSLVNIVAIAGNAALFEEGWMVRADVDELLAEFEGWHDELLSMFAAIPRDQCFKWALHVREPLDRWVTGRTALLGDAAHPMTPFLGLGAGIGIEDALVLARALAAADDLADGLARYEAARVPHANRAQSESARQGLYLLNMRPDEPPDRSLLGEDPFGLFGYDAVNASV
ncbi:MAG: FAD-dependent monooxygenase [Pseudomonadota bacterium]